MTDQQFTPPGIGYALSGSTLTGVLTSIPVFIVSLILNQIVLSRPYQIGSLVVLALLIGLIGSYLQVFLNRPLQHRQQKTLPHGPAVTLNALLAPAIAGAVFAPIFGGAFSLALFGLMSGIIGFMPDLLLTKPWKEDISEQELNRRTREFGDMTRRRVKEYKDALQEQQRQKSRGKNGDPWDQADRQGWWE
ncbi:MFS transporter [Rothia uropygialis]|uniref:hypothetical protein n=1 Tax=Kocuria sp. 36 TaxID=1415402 RepID=UPI00101D312A|nr:hypothetical protein [Kocuria sp. 36]